MTTATVSQEKVRRVIADWVIWMMKKHETLTGVNTDAQIDCPKCGGCRSIVWSGSWRCVNVGCGFEFELHNLPSPFELDEYLEQKKKDARITVLREIVNWENISL